MHHEQSLVDLLRLARTSGVTPRTAALLLGEIGPPGVLFALSPAQLRERGIPGRVASALSRPGLQEEAQAELAQLRLLKAHACGLGLPGYPAYLSEIHDPPLVLSWRGTWAPSPHPLTVAIVGARRASPAGCEIARQLAYDLARHGVTVVSGLARGIDRAAHLGALEGGGLTLAVLGSGLKRIYPESHLELAERITKQGALISEFAPEVTPMPWHFPQRNRIVAGLTLGTVVVQAGPRSGALITADLTLQSGRELLAVPGAITDPLARGPNGLLKDGAHLVESADDVLEVLSHIHPLHCTTTAPTLDSTS